MDDFGDEQDDVPPALVPLPVWDEETDSVLRGSKTSRSRGEKAFRLGWVAMLKEMFPERKYMVAPLAYVPTGQERRRGADNEMDLGVEVMLSLLGESDESVYLFFVENKSPARFNSLSERNKAWKQLYNRLYYIMRDRLVNGTETFKQLKKIGHMWCISAYGYYFSPHKLDFATGEVYPLMENVSPGKRHWHFDATEEKGRDALLAMAYDTLSRLSDAGLGFSLDEIPEPKNWRANLPNFVYSADDSNDLSMSRYHGFNAPAPIVPNPDPYAYEAPGVGPGEEDTEEDLESQEPFSRLPTSLLGTPRPNQNPSHPSGDRAPAPGSENSFSSEPRGITRLALAAVSRHGRLSQRPELSSIAPDEQDSIRPVVSDNSPSDHASMWAEPGTVHSSASLCLVYGANGQPSGMQHRQELRATALGESSRPRNTRLGQQIEKHGIQISSRSPSRERGQAEEPAPSPSTTTRLRVCDQVGDAALVPFNSATSGRPILRTSSHMSARSVLLTDASRRE